MPSRASTVAALITASFAFGLGFVAVKMALRGFEPLLTAFIRFVLGGAVLYLIWRLHSRRQQRQVTRTELGRLALLGFVSITVYIIPANLGMDRTSAGEAAILSGAIPVFVVIINAFTLREYSSVWQWVGVFVSFAGIIGLVGLGARVGHGTMLGDLLVLCASVALAVYVLLARRLLIERSALYVTTYQHLFGALFLAPAVVLEAFVAGTRTPTWPAVGGIAYLALASSVLGYLLFNYALRFVQASRVSVFINLMPVIAVAGAYLLLGERFTPGQMAAAAVVVLGVWLANKGCRASTCPPSA